MHTLGEDRGGTLEALVARMRTTAALPTSRAQGWPGASLRTLAISATLPNLRDVAAWLGVGPGRTFQFGDEYRPTPLTTYVIGFETSSGWGGGGWGWGWGRGRQRSLLLLLPL